VEENTMKEQSAGFFSVLMNLIIAGLSMQDWFDGMSKESSSGT